jgi:predicted permease
LRTILGASRKRITRSLITEGVMLAVLGGSIGWVLAYSSLGLLLRFTSKFTSLASQLQFTPQVALFCVLLSLCCGVVIGGGPAFGVRYTPLFTADVGNTFLPQRIGSKTRSILVAAQLALSVILLVGAGLALRTVIHLQRVDAGFQPSGVLTARLYVLNGKYREFFDQLLKRTRSLRGVESAGLASTIPLHAAGFDGPEPVEVRDAKLGQDEKPNAIIRIVSPEYFRTLGANILQGRDFTDQDNDESRPVVIINQRMANRYWPRGNVLGKQIAVSDGKWIPIIGVVSDVRHLGLDREPMDEAYASFAEAPQGVMSIAVRTSQPLQELSQQLAWIAHDIDPNVVVADVQPMMQVRDSWLASRRTTAMFLTVFAVVALCITASGISGLMALAVGERKHEIGVRLALGATPSLLIRSMMRQVLMLTVLGLATGFAVAWEVANSMSAVVSGIPPRDAVTFGVSSGLLIAVAIASSIVPLKRIAKFDPVVLLAVE